MHELSLAEGVADAVERTAAANGVKKIKSVRIRVGELAGADVEALRFAWLSVRRTTPLLETSELVIERPAGTAWCMDCSCDVPMHALGDACPQCGGFVLIPKGGTELTVADFIPDED